MDGSKSGAVHRLKIAKGHLEKVIEMSEEGAYCIDVIHQIKAVEAGLKKTEEQILRTHLQTCVVDQIKNGKSEKVMEEIMRVVESTN